MSWSDDLKIPEIAMMNYRMLKYNLNYWQEYLIDITELVVYALD